MAVIWIRSLIRDEAGLIARKSLLLQPVVSNIIALYCCAKGRDLHHYSPVLFALDEDLVTA